MPIVSRVSISSRDITLTTATVRKSLGERVRNLRREKSMTQEQLASVSGLHVTYISTVEHGKRNPSLDALLSIATALNVSLSTLFEGI